MAQKNEKWRNQRGEQRGNENVIDSELFPASLDFPVGGQPEGREGTRMDAGKQNRTSNLSCVKTK